MMNCNINKIDLQQEKIGSFDAYKIISSSLRNKFISIYNSFIEKEEHPYYNKNPLKRKDLNTIKEKEYYIYEEYTKNIYILLGTIIDEKYFVLLIDIYFNIYIINLNLSIHFFKGTVLYVEILNNNINVYDIYYLYNENLTSCNYEDRIKKGCKYLNYKPFHIQSPKSFSKYFKNYKKSLKNISFVFIPNNIENEIYIWEPNLKKTINFKIKGSIRENLYELYLMGNNQEDYHYDFTYKVNDKVSQLINKLNLELQPSLNIFDKLNVEQNHNLQYHTDQIVECYYSIKYQKWFPLFQKNKKKSDDFFILQKVLTNIQERITFDELKNKF